jgi:hypothetical protein
LQDPVVIDPSFLMQTCISIIPATGAELVTDAPVDINDLFPFADPHETEMFPALTETPVTN